MSWCSDNNTSGSYSMSDFGDCFSGFTTVSSVGVVLGGLLDIAFVKVMDSVFTSFGRVVCISTTFDTFFTDELLALTSLLHGFIPETREA